MWFPQKDKIFLTIGNINHLRKKEIDINHLRKGEIEVYISKMDRQFF
jgi:hypothetical protein